MAMNIANFLLNILWGPWTPFIILAVALYFTIRTRFVQVRRLKDMFSLLKRNSGKAHEGVSGLQAFILSAASRVGSGNIAGVAGAVCFGGPGAVVWMFIAAILGASSSFIECTLAQIYKERWNGEFRGGTAFYIEKGIGIPMIALLFSIFAYLGLGFGFPLPNTASIVSSVGMATGLPPIVPTVITAVAFAIIVFGGIRRITEFTDKAVPVMATIYIACCIIVLVMHIGEIPAAIALMFNSAFNTKAFLGGMIGTAIMWGVKRGLFSNEAGLGSSTTAAATSDVEHPVQEGLTQTLAVYFDTLLICLIGAVTMITTNSFNVVNPAGEMVIANIPEIESGVLYIQNALATNLGQIANWAVLICVCFFCFTSIVAQYFYAEVNVWRIFKNHQKEATTVARFICIASIFIGGLTYSDFAWAIGDICLGLMALINLPAIVYLGKYALRALKDYEEQKKAGVKVLTFDPEKLGIPGTEPGLWKEISERNIKKYED